MSQIKRISEETSELDMTSMIDVTFLLLIFFICTLRFKTLEGKLSAYLPKDVGVNQSEAEPIEKVEITLRVLQEGNKLLPVLKGTPTEAWDPVRDADKRFVFDNTRIVEYSIGPRKTRDLDELQDRLKVLISADEERPATIDARKGIVYEDVVEVLDRAMTVEFKEVTFIGSHE